MSCLLEFPGSMTKIEFCGSENKQKVLIDILINHDQMDIDKLASVLEVPVKKLKNIYVGNGFLSGEPADSLAQLFLMFLGKNFFRECTLTRNFVH